MINDDGPKRYCRYRVGQQTSFGIIEGDHVFELDSPPTGAHGRTTIMHELAAVELLVPTIPGAMIRVGINYTDYLDRSTSKKQALLPSESPSVPLVPEIRYESGAALIAHDAGIIAPQDSTAHLRYSSELVAVFGKTGKNIPREEALSHVFGWTIGNDVSDRSPQPVPDTFRRPKATFKSMGPWIATGISPDEMITTVQVNGIITDRFHTADMVFDIATCISEVSKKLTIYPGDVLWLGTSRSSRDLCTGDVVEIDISGIGTLRNGVVSARDLIGDPFAGFST